MATNIHDLSIEWKNHFENYEEQQNEIFALESFYENTNDLEIIQEASVENSKLNTLQVLIRVECSSKPINVEICLPIEKINREILKNVDNKENNKLERSMSGYHATTSIKCETLPPVCLNIVLPVSYPSDKQPLFTLSCIWLNKSQIIRLCNELDRIWKEYSGMAVIYTWVEWIKMNTIQYLEILEETDKIIATPLGDYFNNEPIDEEDKRAITTFNDIDTCIYEFLRFNYIEENKTFKITKFTCPLCFDEKYGSECIRISACKHVFCADCLINYCEILVKEGTLQHLKCPEANCNNIVPEEVLRMVLSVENYDRWERLLLQRTLDSMNDVIYCPQCSIAIIVDENDTHAYCLSCRHDFCKICKESFHSGKCNKTGEKIEKKIKTLNLSPNELLALNDQQIRERFKNHDFVIQLREKTVKEIGTAKTENLLKKFKICPNCSAPIDKSDGCNIMRCICGQELCYICGKKIKGYDHFSNGGATCKLWPHIMGNDNIYNSTPNRPVQEGQRAINRFLNLVLGEQRNSIICPTCGQKCLKMERNNHLKCWLCNTNFCFCCKNKITGVVTAHFKIGACKQHSA